MQRWTEIGTCVVPVSSWNPVRRGNGNLITYVDISSIRQNEKVIEVKPPIRASEAPSRARQLIAAGDVLVSTVRPNLNAVAKVPEALDGATASTGFCVLRPDNKKLIGEYLFNWVKSPQFVSEMVKRATGASYPAVSDRIVLESKLPLPPVEEQRRIAAILDKADELRTKRRAVRGQLDCMAQAIFIEMFGDPAGTSKGWRTLPFREVCETRLGKMLDQKRQTGKHRRKYLRNANVQWFGFDLTEVFEMDFDEDAREAFRLQEGDLLICEGGEPGRAAIWRGGMAECYYQKALHRARPFPEVASSEYLVWLLWFLANRGKLVDHVTSATIAHLTGERLAAMVVPVPPLSLQKEFAKRIRAIEKFEAAQDRSHFGMDALFASLQHRAFRGEL